DLAREPEDLPSVRSGTRRTEESSDLVGGSDDRTPGGQWHRRSTSSTPARSRPVPVVSSPASSDLARRDMTLTASPPAHPDSAPAPTSFAVIKRDGSVATFTSDKISTALRKAFLAVEGAGAGDSSRVRDLVTTL